MASGDGSCQRLFWERPVTKEPAALGIALLNMSRRKMAAEHSLTGPIVKISFLLSIVQNTKISANAVPMTLSHSTGYKKLVQIMILNIILHLCSVKHLKFEYFSQSPCGHVCRLSEILMLIPKQPIVSISLCWGKMIISLSMNITMNQLGGASVIAKFHS